MHMMTEPVQQPLKRSFTVPSRPHRTRHTLGSYDAPNILIPPDDLLFYHPSATIIKFELPQSSSLSPILPDLDYPVDAIETLPWRTRSERIAAIGVLRIENIAGSAAFLKSGNVVYALLKNCQCWCVDAKSTFVLRIRKLTYYRVEFPYETEEHINKVEEWKQVLLKTIRYEITPCPFKRGFSVELPEEARTPKKKRAWRPKTALGMPVRSLDFDGSVSSEDREPSDFESVGDETDRLSERSWGLPPASRRASLDCRSTPIWIPKRGSFRVVSEPAPKFETLLAKFQPESELDRRIHDGNGSIASSVSSFHSLGDVPPSPPSPSYSTPLSPERPISEVPSHMNPTSSHTRDTSVATIVPEMENDPASDPEPLFERDQISSVLLALPDTSIPALNAVNHISTTLPIENPNSIIRRRIRASRQRSFSPLPPSSTLYTPVPRSPINNVIDSIFEKTYTFVLGPPIHLLLMFLRLAAEAATSADNARSPAGTGSRRSPSRPETVNRTDDIWSEDDFGNPLSRNTSSRHERDRSVDSVSSSEVD